MPAAVQVIGVAIGAGVLGATSLAFPLSAPISLFDGGLAASAGTFILNGAVPYRDFWWLYGPLAPPIAGVVSAVFGPSLLVIRLLGLATHALQAGAAFALLRQRMPGWAAALLSIGGSCMAAALGGLEFTAWALALGLAITGLAVRAGERHAVAAGVLVGLAFATRFDVGGYALIGALLWGGRRSFLLGFCLGAIPLATVLIVTTPIPSLIEQVVWFPLVGQRVYRSIPVPEVTDGGSLIVFGMLVVVPKVVLGLAAIRLARSRLGDRLLAMVTVFGLLCQLQALGRADYFHQAQAALPAMLAFGIHWADAFRAGVAETRRAAHAVRITTFATVSTIAALSVVMAGTGLARSEPGVLRPEDQELVAMIRTVVRNSHPGEPIFVGLTGHRHTALNDMIVYYLADRPAGVRVAMFNPGVTNTDATQREMADDLAASGTALVVADDRWTFLAEWSNESRLPGSTILDAELAKRYRPVCQYGPLTLLVLPDRAASIACEPTRQETLMDILAGIRP